MESIDDFEDFLENYIDSPSPPDLRTSSPTPGVSTQKTVINLNGVAQTTAKIISVSTTISNATVTTTTTNVSNSSKTSTSSSGSAPVTSTILKKSNTSNRNTTFSKSNNNSITTATSSISSSKNQAVKRSVSPVTTQGPQKKTKLDNEDSKTQGSATTTQTKSNTNSAKNKVPPPKSSSVTPPRPAIVPPAKLPIVPPATLPIIPPATLPIVPPAPLPIVYPAKLQIVPQSALLSLLGSTLTIVPPAKRPIVPSASLLSLLGSALPYVPPPTATPTTITTGLSPVPPVPKLLTSNPTSGTTSLSQSAPPSALPPVSSHTILQSFLNGSTFTTTQNAHTLQRLHKLFSSPTLTDAQKVQYLQHIQSSLKGPPLTAAQNAQLIQRFRAYPSNNLPIAGPFTGPYPYFPNFAATSSRSTSTLILPLIQPVPSTSQATPQIISLPQQPPTFQHVTQKAYEILGQINPTQFTSTFIDSGCFKADKMDSAEPQYYDILEYIFNSQAHQGFGVELLAVLKITRPTTPVPPSPQPSTSTAPQPQNSQATTPTNRFTMMLWHGTKPRSVANILKEGFRCPQTGSQMFGKGVYFADRISKSAQYCNQKSYVCVPKPGEIGYLFLCEVTLGKCYNAKNVKNTYKSAPTATRHDGSVLTFDSLKCTGENVPDRQKQREIDGIIWPLGPTIKNTRFPTYTVLYNEFIVYNPEMVKIKYLVKVQFKKVN